MKIYREVLTTVRLPEKEDFYLVYLTTGRPTTCYFNGKLFELIFNLNDNDTIHSWMERIDIKITSEEILPKDSRYRFGIIENQLLRSQDRWLLKYHKALEAAELQIAQLMQEKINK